MWWKKLAGLLVLGALAALPVNGQSVGGWERTDLFGNPNSTNNPNIYHKILVANNTITLVSESALFGYWTQYDWLGARRWQQRGRAPSYTQELAPWRSGVFTVGTQPDNNPLGTTAVYHWLNATGDTVRVIGKPQTVVRHVGVQILAQDGRYYVAGNGDGSGLGQRPLALHYSLVCLDTAGRLRWQRQYPNPAIRLGPSDPAFVGGYAYLWQVAQAPRQRLLLLGDTQRDSANAQLYAIETDTAGQLRRTRWVEPFGRRADVLMTALTNLVRLRDGSGYVVTGVCQLDSLNRARKRGFVARLDTALRVVWRTLLPAPTRAGPADPTADVIVEQVRERADGGLMVLTYEQFTNGHPRVRPNEFDLVRLTAQGRVVGWDTYCSQVCTFVQPYAWQYLPADSSVLVCGWGQQRDATGRLLAQPGWLARFAAPCRRYVVPAQPTAVAASAGAAGAVQLYPQPAVAGGPLHVVLPSLAGAGPLALHLRDALGREAAVLPIIGAEAEGRVQLPAGLPPGLYFGQVLRQGVPVATARLLVQAPN